MVARTPIAQDIMFAAHVINGFEQRGIGQILKGCAQRIERRLLVFVRCGFRPRLGSGDNSRRGAAAGVLSILGAFLFGDLVRQSTRGSMDVYSEVKRAGFFESGESRWNGRSSRWCPLAAAGKRSPAEKNQRRGQG